jgi:hypothetical protein
MKLPFIIMIYLGWVLISFLILLPLSEEIKERHPSFMDKYWKRVLWVLSCLIFFPLFFTLIFVIELVREFIRGDNKKRVLR